MASITVSAGMPFSRSTALSAVTSMFTGSSSRLRHAAGLDVVVELESSARSSSAAVSSAEPARPNSTWTRPAPSSAHGTSRGVGGRFFTPGLPCASTASVAPAPSTAVTRPVTSWRPPAGPTATVTRRPTLRRQCRSWVSGRSTPGLVTSST